MSLGGESKAEPQTLSQVHRGTEAHRPVEKQRRGMDCWEAVPSNKKRGRTKKGMLN